MSWNWFYIGTQADVVAANAQINSNCGFPNSYAQTWAFPQQAYQQSFWFIMMPPPEGYTEPNGNIITQAQMVAGVVNVTEQQSQSNWWPPLPSGDE